MRYERVPAVRPLSVKTIVWPAPLVTFRKYALPRRMVVPAVRIELAPASRRR